MINNSLATAAELAADNDFIVAYYADEEEGPEITPMTQFEFLNSISKGLVQTEVFYQVFRYPLGDNSTARLHCHARLEEGRYIFKYYKSVIPEDK